MLQIILHLRAHCLNSVTASHTRYTRYTTVRARYSWGLYTKLPGMMHQLMTGYGYHHHFCSYRQGREFKQFNVATDTPERMSCVGLPPSQSSFWGRASSLRCRGLKAHRVNSTVQRQHPHCPPVQQLLDPCQKKQLQKKQERLEGPLERLPLSQDRKYHAVLVHSMCFVFCGLNAF